MRFVLLWVPENGRGPDGFHSRRRVSEQLGCLAQSAPFTRDGFDYAHAAKSSSVLPVASSPLSCSNGLSGPLPYV